VASQTNPRLERLVLTKSPHLAEEKAFAALLDAVKVGI
jgi:hypothetical protein